MIDLSKYKGCKDLSRDLVNDLIAEIEQLRTDLAKVTKLHNALATMSSLRIEQLIADRDKAIESVDLYHGRCKVIFAQRKKLQGILVKLIAERECIGLSNPFWTPGNYELAKAILKEVNR